MAPGARATAQPVRVRIRACATHIANAFQRALHQGPSAGAGGGSSSGKAEAVAGEPEEEVVEETADMSEEECGDLDDDDEADRAMEQSISGHKRPRERQA